MIDVVQCVGCGVLPSTQKDILEKYVDMCVVETKEEIQKLKSIWEEYGCSLLYDGWTGPTKMFIINFMEYSEGEIVFLNSVDVSIKEKNYRYIMEVMEEKNKEIGK